MNNHSPDFQIIFQSLPGNYLIVAPNPPDFTIIAVSDNYLEATSTKREDIVGRNIFDVFPDNPNNPHAAINAKLTKSFEAVIAEKVPHVMAIQKYAIAVSNEKDFELRFWLPKNFPVLNHSGEVLHIIHTVVDVTEQVADRKERENLKLDQKAYELFMQAPVAICILQGTEYIIELANDPVLELWGKDSSIIGKPILQALPEIKGQGFIELLDKVRITGQPYHANEVAAALVRNAVEEIVYLNFVYQPCYDINCSISGVIAIANEVTEQVNARKKIEESEQRLRSLITEATVATGLYTGSEMKIEYANDVMLQVWGKNASVIGKTLREALPELEGQPFHTLLNLVYTTGETYWGKEDKVVLVADGNLQSFFFNFTYKALRDSNGEIYGILNTAIDVTEQVLARQMLEESEARLRLAVEAAHLGTYEFDLINRTVIHSVRTAEIFGYNPNEKLSHDFFIKSIYPPDLSIRDTAYEEALKTGELFYEIRIILRDNTIRWIKVNGKHRLEKGIPALTIGTVMDITEEKKSADILEQRIKERTRELEEANELLARSNSELEQYAHAASHDLKEPLRKIRTFNQMIKKESYDILSERSKTLLDKSSDSAERMAAFLDALLEYTELKKTEELVDIDMNAVVSDVLYDLELVIHEKAAEINIQPLPVIKGISHQLHQLFYNLINNSLKFSKADIPPVIDIAVNKVDLKYVQQHTFLKHKNQYVEIIIKDNGIGFDQKHAAQIFTVFKRLHNKTAYKGTGIGLALCKKVVLNHGGDIFASALPDKGAAFHIILPAD
jgi:PAS domain S-box-containing protein